MFTAPSIHPDTSPFGDECEPGDMVDLVVVLSHNYLRMGMTRQWATHIIRNWYHARERRRLGIPAEAEEQALNDILLKHGTLAMNVKYSEAVVKKLPAEAEDSWVYWAVGWEHVLGMYVAGPHVCRTHGAPPAEGTYEHTLHEIAKIQLRTLQAEQKYKAADEDEDDNA